MTRDRESRVSLWILLCRAPVPFGPRLSQSWNCINRWSSLLRSSTLSAVSTDFFESGDVIRVIGLHHAVPEIEIYAVVTSAVLVVHIVVGRRIVQFPEPMVRIAGRKKFKTRMAHHI